MFLCNGMLMLIMNESFKMHLNIVNCIFLLFGRCLAVFLINQYNNNTNTLSNIMLYETILPE